MGHEPASQQRRRTTGKETERLVHEILTADPKLKGWEFEFAGELDREGLDVKLTPPVSCEKQPYRPDCRPPLFFEVKAVEKLFEHDAEAPWPHNRTSRWTLKKDEHPHCYVLVTRDDITDHVALDFVENAGELAAWKARQFGKSQKLPVRALPRLRLRPCPHVSKKRFVVRATS